MAADTELQRTLDSVHKKVKDRIDDGTIPDLDNATVKEIRLKALQETDRLLTNDEKASIISVVVYVAVT